MAINYLHNMDGFDRNDIGQYAQDLTSNTADLVAKWNCTSTESDTPRYTKYGKPGNVIPELLKSIGGRHMSV